VQNVREICIKFVDMRVKTKPGQVLVNLRVFILRLHAFVSVSVCFDCRICMCLCACLSMYVLTFWDGGTFAL
jgi:hypothetical protein